MLPGLHMQAWPRSHTNELTAGHVQSQKSRCLTSRPSFVGRGSAPACFLPPTLSWCGGIPFAYAQGACRREGVRENGPTAYWASFGLYSQGITGRKYRSVATHPLAYVIARFQSQRKTCNIHTSFTVTVQCIECSWETCVIHTCI